MSKREALIDAAKTLLWEEGFEAMSPKKVMRASGAGQGSLYHHFDGKEHLAIAALEELAIDMKAVADEIFDQKKEPLARLSDYLMRPRAELMGCRFGKLTSERSVCDNQISSLISDYFDHVAYLIERALAEGVAAGDLPAAIPIVDLSKTLMAVIQGGFVLARGKQDAAQMQQAQRGALVMIEALSQQAHTTKTGKH